MSRRTSAQRQAEGALRESRQRLETVVNYMPAPVCLIRGSDLRLQLANPAYRAVAPGKKMVGKTLNELWPETGRDFAKICRRVLKTGQPHWAVDELTMIRRRADGPLEPAYFAWSLHRVRLPGDEGWGLLNAAWETTERKRAEAAVQQERDRLAALVASMSEEVWFADTQKRFTLVNPAALKEFGLETCMTDVKKLAQSLEVLRPDGSRRPVEEAPPLRALKGEVITNQEEVIRTPATGDLRYRQVNARPVRARDGRIIGSVSVVRDITDRKQAEEALRISKDRLKADLDATRKLAELGMLCAREGELKPVLTAVVDAAIAMSGADFGNIQLLDPASGDLNIVAQRGFPKWWVRFWNRVSRGKGVCGSALECGRRLIVEDVKESPIFVGTPALQVQLKAGVRAVQSTPLASRSGKILGMFSTHYRTPQRPDERTLALLDLLARQASDLIERAQAEAALAESERRYRLAVDFTYDWEYWLDPQGRFIYVSPSCERIIGYKAADFLARPGLMRRLVHPADRARYDARTRHRHGPDQNSEQEWRMRRRDGSYCWIGHTCQMVFGERGQPLGVRGSNRDITDRKQAEEALRELNATLEQRVAQRTTALQESEMRFRTIFDAAGDGMFLNDIRCGRIVLANKAFLELLGYTLEELTALSLEDLHLKEELPLIKSEIAKFLHGRKPGRGEVHFRRKDGSLFLAELSPAPIRLAEKGYALVVVRDVTTRNEVELVRARLAAIVESSTDAILATDVKGVITAWAAGAQRLYGYSAAEAVGKLITLVVPPDKRSESARFFEKVRRGESTIDCETERVRKDRQRIPVSITISPMRDAAGQIVGSSHISRDIAERKRLERQLLEVGEREQQRIAHDLHDGLCQEVNGLCILARLLERELKLELPCRAAEAGRLAKVLDHILRLSRDLVHGLQPVYPLPEGLMLTLRELAERTRDLYGVDCRFECRQPVMIPHHSAATHLYRIAQEAVNNALKHGRPTRILIRLAAGPPGIVLGVRDNGVGFRRKKGPFRGMGLHIMQQRTEAICGSLVVQRHPDGGTEVVCTVASEALLSPKKDQNENHTIQ